TRRWASIVPVGLIMPHRDVNGKRRPDACAHDVRPEPTDPHPLVPPPQTGLDGERAAADAQRRGEQRQKLPVRCPTDGLRSQTDTEGRTVKPDDTCPRFPRTHVDQNHRVFADGAYPAGRLRQRGPTTPPPA